MKAEQAKQHPAEELFGGVPNGWEATTLGEVCERGGGFIQTGPFGSQLHAADYVPVGIPSIMPVNIGDNRVVRAGIECIREADAVRLSRHRVRPGDIIYSRRGDVERRALIRSEEEGWLCGTGCLLVRFGDAVDPVYLSYYLGHPYVRAWIVRHAVGATMPNLNTGIMDAIPVLVPPHAEQKTIAGILGALDDKIETNRRMNRVLEGIARAVFRSWFVDFDPVHAKAAGRAPVGMDADTAALFPGTFEDSSLGPIPAGWRVRAIGDVLEVQHGFAFEGEHIRDEPAGDILLTPGNFAVGGGFKESKYKYYDGPVLDGYILQQGDLIITMTDLSKAADTLGYPAIIPSPPANRKYLHNQRLGKVQLTEPDSVNNAFLYQVFCTSNYRGEILAGATGTTVKHTAPKRIQAFKTVFPSSSLMKRFDSLAVSWQQRMATCREESHTLSSLRDTLLPKLISGEVRVPA